MGRRGHGTEGPRDQVESGFTPVLRELWTNHEAIFAAVFVDGEGECVDYCSSIDVFDAKVAAAHMVVVVAEMVDRIVRVGFGQSRELQLIGDARDIVVRRVNDEYSLVVVLRAGGVTSGVLHGIDLAVDALRKEGAIPPPRWEPRAARLEVEIRAAVGWDYAPQTLLHEGKRIEVSGVLGRWVDGGEGGLVCFRVRTREGKELTVAHDAEGGGWSLLTESEAGGPAA